MLEINNIFSGYGKVVALQGVSLTVSKGQIVTIIGTNGSGKSTILKTIIGIVPILEGNVFFNGNRIGGLRSNKIVRRGISIVPEGRQIFPDLTVRENLRIGAYSRKKKFGMDEDYERVFRIFPVLKKRLRQQGGTLSGGEQQMLAIARALMARPQFLLMDEPSLGLAPLVIEDIFKVIRQINNEGVTILLVEQNVHMALSVAEHGFVLDSGKIVLEGKSSSLAEDELVQRSFLG
jgi:branched-chain amino acid transport system ATP-binding protein